MGLQGAQLQITELLANLLLLASLGLGIALFRADQDLHYSSSLLHWALYFTSYLILSAGMSYRNTRAVLEGHLRKPSAFVRTPKTHQLKRRRSKTIPVIEALITLLAVSSASRAYDTQQLALLGIPLFTFLAFGWVTIAQLKHS